MPRGQPPFLENLRSKNSTHFFKHGEPPKDVQATSRLPYAAAGVPKGVPAGGSSTSGRIAERTGAAPPPPPPRPAKPPHLPGAQAHNRYPLHASGDVRGCQTEERSQHWEDGLEARAPDAPIGGRRRRRAPRLESS